MNSKPRCFAAILVAAMIAAAIALTTPQSVEPPPSPVALPAAETVDSVALLAKHYPAAKPSPREEVTLIRTADGFEPRFAGKIEPQINTPGSRWKNPAKAVLPKFPSHFNNPMCVSSTFDSRRSTGVPPVSLPAGQRTAVVPPANPQQITYAASAVPLNANPSSSGEIASDGSLIYKNAFGAGIDVMYRVQALKTEEFIVIRESATGGLSTSARECATGGLSTSARESATGGLPTSARECATGGLPTSESGADTPAGDQSRARKQAGATDARQFSWDLSLGEGEAALKPRLTPMHTIELCDGKGVPRLRIDLPEGKDAQGHRLSAGKELRYTLEGNRVTLSADLRAAKFPVIIDPSWSSTGAMAVERSWHTATTLDDGTVLVAGGYRGDQSIPNHYIPECELFNPGTGTWTTTTGGLNTTRYDHTATKLADGSVVVAGGYNSDTGPGLLSSCEKYNPISKTWSVIGSLNNARVEHSAVLLSSGKILIIGGSVPSITELCEIFDPSDGTSSNIGSLSIPRRYHGTAVLNDGGVLVCGGETAFENGSYSGSSEILNLSTNTWQPAAPLSVPRSGFELIVLDDGKVLAAGGINFGTYHRTTEIYNPSQNDWTSVGNASSAHYLSASAKLANGKALMISGVNGNSSTTTTCDLFDPDTLAWRTVGETSTDRIAGKASLLNNGNVLITGGTTLAGSYLKLTEVFDAKPEGLADSFSVLHDAPALLTLSADSIGTSLSYSVTTQPAHGVLSGTAPNLTFTPEAGYVGADAFSFQAADSFGQSVPVVVTLDITNVAPVANVQTFSTHFNTDLSIVLTASDADNDSLTYSLVTLPTHGTLSGSPPNLVYSPETGYLGGDSFTFKANDSVLDSELAVISIVIANSSPSVTAIASPSVVTPGELVSFISNGADPDGDLFTYSWSFGDNNSSTDQNPVHAYNEVGSYIATVTVTDAAGATGSASVVIVVSKAPIVRITTDEVVGFGGLPLLFDASYSTDPENQIASYSWDFGDGTPLGSGQIISKIYDQPGTYTVTLTVTDAAGVSSSLQRVIEVLPADQVGLFNGFVNYKVRWDRDADSKDTLQLTAQVNVGEQVVGTGTTVALDIVGQHFEGTLDTKLRDKSDSNDVWQVKANLRHQPFGTVQLKLKIKNASLGLGFNQAGAVKGGDAHDLVDAEIPVRLTIGGRSFEINVASEFKFNTSGKKARGEGDE